MPLLYNLSVLGPLEPRLGIIITQLLWRSLVVVHTNVSYKISSDVCYAPLRSVCFALRLFVRDQRPMGNCNKLAHRSSMIYNSDRACTARLPVRLCAKYSAKYNGVKYIYLSDPNLYPNPCRAMATAAAAAQGSPLRASGQYTRTEIMDLYLRI